MTYQRFPSVLGRCLESVRFLLDTRGYQVPQVVGPKGPPFFLHACDRSLHTVRPSDGFVTRIWHCPLATTSARRLMLVTPLSTGLTLPCYKSLQMFEDWTHLPVYMICANFVLKSCAPWRHQQTWYKRKFLLEKKNKKLQNKACHDILPRYLKPLWPKSNPHTEMESQTKKFSKELNRIAFKR